MSQLTINDLTVSNELDRSAMAKVSGGLNFESKSTVIAGFSIGTIDAEPQATSTRDSNGVDPSRNFSYHWGYD
jgi:hypothetical protein